MSGPKKYRATVHGPAGPDGGHTLSAKDEAAALVSLARGRVSEAALRMRLKEASLGARLMAKWDIVALDRDRYLDAVNQVCRELGETEVP